MAQGESIKLKAISYPLGINEVADSITITASANGTQTEWNSGITAGLSLFRLPGTVQVTAGAVTGTDNGLGLITGTGIAESHCRYDHGMYYVKFDTAPAAATPVYLKYRRYGTQHQQMYWSVVK